MTPQGKGKSLLSIVIPVFNEGQNVALVHTALHEALAKLPRYTYEIVFVDDGSADNTWEQITLITGVDPFVHGIRFSRNFGKEAALEAGFRAAKGDAVIALDGDLQHPPELIPTLVDAWEQGNDVVGTHHISAVHNAAASFLFYRILNAISDAPINPGASDFCLLSRRTVDTLNALSEKQRFHRVLTHWLGLPSVSVPYEPGVRSRGSSVYTPRKLLSFARSAIISSGTMPMTIIFLLGCLLSLFGGVLVVGLFAYKYIVDIGMPGAAILAAFIIFNNGLLFIAFGIMSLYQAAMYREIQNRPSSIIRETL